MIESRTIGVNFDRQGIAAVTVWAPDAQTVSLSLSGRKTDIPLEKKQRGYWELLTSQIKTGDTYHFLLDGDKELPDPASLAQPDGVHGASEALCLNDFNWTDDSWVNPPQEEYVIYELHAGTFSMQGDFRGVEDKLDYLKELGITAIELMPVAQFPGERNWGYDGVFPYAVQNSYGGAKGLMQLVNACHQKGIAVVLDVVYNHIGPEGNAFNDYGKYFTTKYNTPWGKAINFDDEWCDAVRDYYIQNALMWFRDFHIDALRMDAVHAIKDFSTKHILQEIKERINELTLAKGKQYYLMVELDLNDPRFIDPIEKRGYGMDAQWIDEFHHALRVTAGGDKNGYYSDFNGINDLAKAYRDAYVYNGIYSQHRLKTFGAKAQDNPGKQFIAFSQNHDQVGNRMLGERSSRLFTFEMQKLMAGAVLIAPYLPLLFMGEEWSAQTPFQYFVSHSDPDLIEAVRKGRKEEFAAFHAQGEAPDPQSKETFNYSKLNWDELTTDNSQKMLDYYKSLIALRKKLPALRNLDRKNISVTTLEDQNILVFERRYREQTVSCIMNFSAEEQQFNLYDKADWKEILNSADQRWNGPGVSSTSIQPQSLIIYNHV
ncbi:malto-oligosyltrehalose trehalohydrolase [Mucilaginibacter sp.]